MGATEDISNEGLARQEEFITLCLRKAGFEHDPATVLSNRVDLIGGRGPVAVYFGTVDHPELYSFGSGSFDPQTGQAIPAPPEERKAYDSCLADWDATLKAKTDSVQADVDRLNAKWVSFSSSQTYVSAMEEWSSCMKTKGFDYSSIDEATQHLSDIVANALQNLTESSDTTALRADLEKEENAVQGAAQQCWTGTLKPVLEQYNKELVQDFGTQIAAIQAAYSGSTT